MEGTYKKVIFTPCFDDDDKVTLLLTDDQFRVFEYLIKENLVEGEIKLCDNSNNNRWKKI